jgi:cell division control protein 6
MTEQTDGSDTPDTERDEQSDVEGGDRATPAGTLDRARPDSADSPGDSQPDSTAVRGETPDTDLTAFPNVTESRSDSPDASAEGTEAPAETESPAVDPDSLPDTESPSVDPDSLPDTDPPSVDPDSLPDTDAVSDTTTDPDSRDGTAGLFDDLLSGEPIFENKEVLRPAYTPRELPHREDQIDNMATILVSALRGDTPSNILIYGKTGTGKTASAKFVSDELEQTSQKYEVPCEVEYINCEVTDTQYRVLAQLANKFIDKNHETLERRIEDLEAVRERAPANDALTDTEFDTVEELETGLDRLRSDLDSFEEVPMTGWPTDRVYNSFFEAVDYRERVVVIMLDEIDKLVEKSGDDTLYNLSRMNSELERSRVSIIGISNDLKFTDFLDPRVKSSLGEEEIVFPPYDANQLRDILQYRASVAFEEDALTDDVIPLCAAFAAQEHGDARRALDLLRTAGELAERDDTNHVEEGHVRQAQEKIEIDRVVEVVRTLPQQSKLVLFAIILLERQDVKTINTGEVYNVYKQLCEEIDADVLTQRRVTDLISELDMLGIVSAVVVSKGRYGRTKEISLSVPVEETEAVLLSDSRLGDIEDVQPFVQSRFDG